jgi:hypothetical protein
LPAGAGRRLERRGWGRTRPRSAKHRDGYGDSDSEHDDDLRDPPEERAARRERQAAVGARGGPSGGIHDIFHAVVGGAGIGDRDEVDIGAFATRHIVSMVWGLAEVYASAPGAIAFHS